MIRWRTRVLGAVLSALVTVIPPWGVTTALRAAETSPSPPHPSLEELEGMACVDCHSDLLEGKVQHPPAAEQECQTCHEIRAGNGGASVALAAPAPELCEICHGSVTDGLGEPFVHGAVSALGCTGCHDPHASDFPRMLRVESNALCQACHFSAISPDAREEGSVVVLFGAHSVPLADYSAFPRIFVRPRDGRGHPVARHPVRGDSDPLRPGEPFGCTSCHRPHASSRKPLLIEPASGSFCQGCHRK